MPPLFQDGDIVLFQGDSITDAGRYRPDPAHLGYGYVMQAASWFHARYPAKNVHFLNRGISGNRVTDLAARWQEDCLELRPTWLSLLIGINETWRRYDSDDPTSTHDYEHAYRKLLAQTQATLHTRLILCEPFVLPVPADRAAWREDLDPKIAVVRKLAREYHALYVPFDGIFAQAATQREPAFWAADGVHPSDAGHALMAQAWLRTVRAL
ncbi:MAG: SGNH/GDSL hydrolase family protein [Ktedonobacteraceae bacterium]